MNEKVKGMLGLAMRAGCVTDGTERAIGEVQHGKSALMLLDANASANTAKRVKDKCLFYGADVFTLPGGFLDEATGKSGRMAVAIKKGGFEKQIRNLLSEDEDPAP